MNIIPQGTFGDDSETSAEVGLSGVGHGGGHVTEDVLGSDFAQEVLTLPDDYEGRVVATLVSRKRRGRTGKAVLYVHGYVDYFFQREMAERYCDMGFDFYALDLRKYGRSLRPGQTPNFCKDIREYYPELNRAVEIIRERDGHGELLLSGHSTGGLIASLYADSVRSRNTIQALFLNSPFFEFNESWVKRQVLIRLVSAVGRCCPFIEVPGGLSDLYGRSLHRDFAGEWAYNLEWKPCEGFPTTAGWLRAIHKAQKKLQAGLAIACPVLIMTSAQSCRFKVWDDRIMSTDAILNTDDINRCAGSIGDRITRIRIAGGMHDLVLSAKEVRERVYTDLKTWLATCG